MKILDVFDAIRDGSFEDFQHFYDGQVNKIDHSLDINLLCMAVVNDNNSDDKVKILKFLLSHGVDINYTTQEEKRNVLHLFYFCNLKPNLEYALEVTNILINHNVDVNAKDKYGAIPLKYAVTINNYSTYDNKKMYQLLIENGANYNEKDIFGESCVDYAKELSWRNDLLDIIKEYEDGNK